MNDPISFSIRGKPATQGSKKAFAIRNRAGDIMTRPGGAPMITIVNNDPRLKSWRMQVRDAAEEVYHDPPLLGPVFMKVEFLRPRPQNQYRTGQFKNSVKKTALSWPYNRPDSTKLLRAVEDALSGVIYKDDSQIVMTLVSKDYAEEFLTNVSIVSLPPTLEERSEAEAVMSLKLPE